MMRIEDPGRDPNLRVALQRRYLGYGLELGAAAKAALHRLSGQPGPEKLFLIFGRGRSGSTLLTRLLDNHSDITCKGEILRYRARNPARKLRQTLALAPTRVSGCKLLSYQMRGIHRMGPDSSFLRGLAADGAEIIYLRRDNLVRHAVSNLYARKRRAYHSSDRGAQKAARIRIAPEEIFAWMEGSAQLEAYEEAVLRGVPHTALTYERHLSREADQAQTNSMLLRRFGLAHQPPRAELRKVTPARFADIISNHAELMAALQASPYARFLDDAEALQS